MPFGSLGGFGLGVGLWLDKQCREDATDRGSADEGVERKGGVALAVMTIVLVIAQT